MMHTVCPICNANVATGYIPDGPALDQRMRDHLSVCRGPVEGRKQDGGKPRLDLLPPRAITEIGKVLEFGARKYAPDNWRKVEGWRWRYSGAALRHLFAWLGGEPNDPESGLHHLAHAGCCVLFLLEKEIA